MAKVEQTIHQEVASEFRRLAASVFEDLKIETSTDGSRMVTVTTPWWTYDMTIFLTEDGTLGYLTITTSGENGKRTGISLRADNVIINPVDELSSLGWAPPSIPGGILGIKDYFERRNMPRGLGACGLGSCETLNHLSEESAENDRRNVNR